MINPTYQELLLSPKWQFKRSLILKRDFLQCTNCKNSKIIEESVRGTVAKIFKPHQILYVMDQGAGLLRNVYRVEFHSSDQVKRIGWISLDNASVFQWGTEIELFYSFLSKGDYKHGEAEDEKFYITLVRDKNSQQPYFCRELHAHHM